MNGRRKNLLFTNVFFYGNLVATSIVRYAKEDHYVFLPYFTLFIFAFFDVWSIDTFFVSEDFFIKVCSNVYLDDAPSLKHFFFTSLSYYQILCGISWDSYYLINFILKNEKDYYRSLNTIVWNWCHFFST